ncbi:MAG: DNA polymerase III subunit delta' [bacterium]|nr:DNA polymerase III subunit delta' [bacterium]
MAGFREIIGHEQIITNMKQAIRFDKVSHAYILSGEERMGKRMLADAFAMTLLCEKGGVEPCMECHSCKQFLSGNHPDVVYVSHEKPNSIGVEEIRQQVNDDIRIRPYSSPYKVYIMEEAELMTESAQNALLKTIEEPPSYAVLCLLTANEKRLLSTILSRCVKFSLRPLPDEKIREFLAVHYGVEGEAADLYVGFARGNLGKAMHLVESEDFRQLYDEVLHVLRHQQEMNLSELLDAIRKMTEDKLNLDDILDFMQIWYRDILMFKVTKDANLLIFKEETATIREVVATSSYEGVEKILEALDRARARIRANVNQELAMELLLLVIKENSK